MLRAGKAAASKDADWHLKIPSELLAHHIRRNLGGAENGMQTAVDGHALIHPVQAVGVIVTLLELNQRQVGRAVSIHLVCARKTERGIAAEIAHCYQQVQRSDGVYVEIFIRNGRGLVMRRLGRGVDDEIGALGLDEVPHTLAKVVFCLLDRATQSYVTARDQALHEFRRSIEGGGTLRGI